MGGVGTVQVWDGVGMDRGGESIGCSGHRGEVGIGMGRINTGMKVCMYSGLGIGWSGCGVEMLHVSRANKEKEEKVRMSEQSVVFSYL